MTTGRLTFLFSLLVFVVAGCRPRPPSDPVPSHDTIRLAGNLVAETFVVEPELLDAYIAISPSLWWNEGRIAEELRGRMSAFAGVLEHDGAALRWALGPWSAEGA